MKNDGRWCWYLRATDIGNRTFGVKMHIVRQPQHGEAAITVLERATRIAYKPFTDFEGLDEFSVNNDMFNVERPYKIVVSSRTERAAAATKPCEVDWGSRHSPSIIRAQRGE